MRHARMWGFRPPHVKGGLCLQQTISRPHRLVVRRIMFAILGRRCSACRSLLLVGMPRRIRILWV
nr:MAG TPA: hypothetical protein [Caudoviricetes sp.]